MRISDWSSDVCSSDLALGVDSGHIRPGPAIAEQDLDALRRQIGPLRVADDDVRQYLAAKADPLGRIARGNAAAEIGRAACRERVCQYVKLSGGDVALKQNRY